MRSESRSASAKRLAGQLMRFGAVGAVGLVIDVGVFNILRLTVLSPENLHEGPVIAKLISTSLAIIANWLGNRHWTFRRAQRANPVGEGLRFAAVSVAAMVIPLTCLWLSHYVLGFTSALADNISTNVVGLGLGMVFRFLLYRSWVFAEPSVDTAADAAANPEPSLRAPEGPIRPPGSAPLRGIKAVAPIDDRSRPHE
ncbi:GtrA family protein [Salinibacterium hongtaonis]|nr:GtrA family protein [Salinibacterium hongtaonis]